MTAPARALTTDEAAALARWQLGIGGEDEPAFLSDTPEGFHEGDALVAYILSVLPIVAAAERAIDTADEWTRWAENHPRDMDEGSLLARRGEEAWHVVRAAVRTRRAQMTGGE